MATRTQGAVVAPRVEAAALRRLVRDLISPLAPVVGHRVNRLAVALGFYVADRNQEMLTGPASGRRESDGLPLRVRMAVVARMVFYESIDHVSRLLPATFLRSILCLTCKDTD